MWNIAIIILVWHDSKNFIIYRNRPYSLCLNSRGSHLKKYESRCVFLISYFEISVISVIIKKAYVFTFLFIYVKILQNYHCMVTETRKRIKNEKGKQTVRYLEICSCIACVGFALPSYCSKRKYKFLLRAMVFSFLRSIFYNILTKIKDKFAFLFDRDCFT